MEDTDEELGTLDERLVHMIIAVHRVIDSASDEDHGETAERLARVFMKYELVDHPRRMANRILKLKPTW